MSPAGASNSPTIVAAARGAQDKTVVVVRQQESAAIVGPQSQRLTPCITSKVCGTTGISAGTVRMAPGAVSKAHFHAHSEIVVMCLRGHAATLIGPQLTPYLHGPGEFIYIPEGIVHVAVNLSDAEELRAVEMRTDPGFNDDVVLTPIYDELVPELAALLRHT
ncbi:MAG: cupin domain-containing protein, partial [Mycobacterium sp.]|nr:cupin domain-containing protein [Mycobacterium sp.]